MGVSVPVPSLLMTWRGRGEGEYLGRWAEGPQLPISSPTYWMDPAAPTGPCFFSAGPRVQPSNDSGASDLA